MPRKYENVRLTIRDEEAIKWIAEQQVIRFDTLQELFRIRKTPVSKSDLYSICERWKRLGYVKKEKIIGNAPMIIWATSKAIKLAGLPIDKNEKFGKPSFSTIHHNCAVSAVRLEYEKIGYKWICERSLRQEFLSSHLPDGLAYNNEFRILIEVDRTQKKSKRLQNIMSVNARTSGINCVDYWVTNGLIEIANANLQKLQSDIRNRIRIFALPLVVNE